MHNHQTRYLPLLTTLAMGLILGGCGSSLKESVRRDIVAQISNQRLVLRRCYRQALKRNRATRGQVTVRFVVAQSTGEFEQVNVIHNDLKDELLKRCLLSRVQKLKLQQSTDKPIVVTYPVRFEVEPPNR